MTYLNKKTDLGFYSPFFEAEETRALRRNTPDSVNDEIYLTRVLIRRLFSQLIDQAQPISLNEQMKLIALMLRCMETLSRLQNSQNGEMNDISRTLFAILEEEKHGI